MTKSPKPDSKKAAEHIQGELGAHVLQKIVKRRKGLTLSAEQVDEALGKPQGWFRNLEAGKTPIRADDLLAISDTFSIGMGYFFDGYGQERGTMTAEEALAMLKDLQKEAGKG